VPAGEPLAKISPSHPTGDADDSLIDFDFDTGLIFIANLPDDPTFATEKGV
jgi:hypothetical protein